MTRTLAALLLFAALPTFAQQPSTPTPAPDENTAQATEGEQNRSALAVKPGEQTLKNKDLFDKTGYFHPFRRMPRFIIVDQKKIWTSPFHTSKKDIKYWAIFGGGTAALVLFDEKIQRNAPNPGWLVSLGTDGSLLGTAYTLIPLSAGFYFVGTKAGDDRLREAGLMSFEALIDSTIVQEVFKGIADRQRPLEGSGEGQFFKSTNRINSSFPSGHAFNTFALASVFAHEYHDKLWVKILAYGYAGAVAGARLAANKHFPSDTLAGGAMGWFIGDYIYGKRHNSELDHKPTVTQKILSHVQVGFGGY